MHSLIDDEDATSVVGNKPSVGVHFLHELKKKRKEKNAGLWICGTD